MTERVSYEVEEEHWDTHEWFRVVRVIHREGTPPPTRARSVMGRKVRIGWKRQQEVALYSDRKTANHVRDALMAARHDERWG